MWGGNFGVKTVKSFGPIERVSGEATMSLANGNVTYADSTVRREVGGMAPVQLRAAVEVTTGRWSIAPRLVLVGDQRTLAIRGIERRQLLDGYRTVNLHVRRAQPFKGLDAFADARFFSVRNRLLGTIATAPGVPGCARQLHLALVQCEP
jgi:hypothetical protein